MVSRISEAIQTATPRATRAARFPGAWLDAAILLSVGAVMASWSWMKWADPSADFGKELTMAWQLCLGKDLYTGIAYDAGPLSPYLNAMIFTLFGPRLDALIGANFIVLTAIVVLLYRIFRIIGGRLAATAGCVVFLTMFAFSQHTYFSGYNYICPYRHEMTHGFLLALAAIAATIEYFRTLRPGWILSTGICLGLLFLTKVEIFLPAFLACGVGMLLSFWRQKRTVVNSAQLLALGLGSMIVPPLIALILLNTQIPFREAWMGLFSGWFVSGDAAFWSPDFYRESLGLSAPLENLQKMFRGAAWYALIFGAFATAAFFKREFQKAGPVLAKIAFGLMSAILIYQWFRMDWLEAARPLPVMMLLLLAAHLYLRRKDPAWFPNRAALLSRLAVILFAFLLLGKMMLNARIHQYGFVLAAPAVLVAVTALLVWIPNGLTRLGGQGSLFRLAAGLFLAIAVFSHLLPTATFLHQKVAVIGQGSNRFLADTEMAVPVNQTLSALAEHSTGGSTLAAYPDGGMLNYLSRRDNPTPYLNLMPHEVAYFGEEKILQSLKANPPDFIALVHKDTSEFGQRFFGRDYAPDIYAWITWNYEPVKILGAAPFNETDLFGILLLKHKVVE
jgi:4-amino-4-deoxy-L-arabinose transferase-like glycosyltransferase